MTRILKIAFQIFLALSLTDIAFAQFGVVTNHIPGKERGDPKYRANGQMEGNRVRATIFNFAFTGREGGQFPIDVQTPYEWPKNTGEVYLALTGLMMGGEVTDNKGQLQHIIDVPDFRTSLDGKTWNLEPIPGYANPNANTIANSIDPDTWPPYWPDKLNDPKDPGWKGEWNGYFGKNIFNADQEMFAKASDDRYDRYADYFPDSTDLTRKGMGIIVEQRTLAWSQVLLQDDVFLLYTLVNDGTKDIPKMGVTIWFADFVGGNGDSGDDIADYDILNAFLWSRDSDNRAPTFGNDPVGAVALSFLETPGNATDRVDNDGDGESGGPIITENMLLDESPDNGIDDNHNGLIDENEGDVAFGLQVGKTFANGLDDNNNGEIGSPVVTQDMINQASTDSWTNPTTGQTYHWNRWPPNPESDTLWYSNGFNSNTTWDPRSVWLTGLTQNDLGKKYKDNIDNDGNSPGCSYNNLPTVTQAMINQAASDPYNRYKVPGTHVVLYSLTQADLDKPYLNKDGLRDCGVDEGIDEMIDESRTDGVDNDGDWNRLTDDVGLDGVPETGDFGESDGKPTSGVGTGEPGEPHIDLTDIKETDQIGITGADKISANGLNINSDATMWFDFMIPGKFFNSLVGQQPGDYDLFVSSSLFPMKAGDVQPFSMVVILANGPVNDPGWSIRKQQILTKRNNANQAYQNNYKFAVAPITPILTAIPGDHKVTLYWDDKAESSYDSFTAKIGGDGHNFEGYRIYRASDPAFLDATNITNGYGTPLFLSPLVIYDLKDGIKGFDSLGIDGIHYNLGTDSGLKHSYVDTTVQNGFVYYYAVVSYSKGFSAGGILPAESPIRVSLKSDGTVKLGPNVARVTPESVAAGYVGATLGQIKLIQGTTTSTVGYNIVDPDKIKNEHVYYITFQDTTIAGAPGKPDTLTTRNFTLTDSTGNDVLIYQSTNMQSSYEQPITDGFQLSFNNAQQVAINTDESKWNDPNVPAFVFEKYVAPGGVTGTERPNDYEVFFGNVGMDTSITIKYGTVTFPPKPVNFKVLNTSTSQYVKCGFIEADTTGGVGKFTAKGGLKDRIIFFEPNAEGNLVNTWWFYLSAGPNASLGQTNPMPGDTAYIKLKKPFLSEDVFSFTAKSAAINNTLAAASLDNIKVVPNPYLGSAQWEIKNPYTSGRGPRSLHFTHLPAKCTLRIFTVDGELVQTLYHDSPIADGTEDWNMLTKDNLGIAYGVYVYYVEAPGIGTKIGKFAVIK